MRIVVENLISRETKKYPFNSAEDIRMFMEKFPNLDYLRSITHDIKDLAANICDVLGNHHLDCFTEESEHYVDEDPWTEHKYNRGEDLSNWAKAYNAKNK